METCWRITKNEKHFVSEIHKMFLSKEDFGHINFIFDYWLDDDINEVHIIKNDKKWSYLLTGKNLPETNGTILDINHLLTSLN